MHNLKIGLLGGTKVHDDLSLNLKKLKATCYIFDKNPNCYASKNIDFINIDFGNHKKILNFVKKRKINFLYITQSDSGLLTLGYLNSKLNLPGTSYKLAKKLKDKHKTRNILKRNNFFQPEYFALKKNYNNFKLKNKIYLVKPTDSSGSRGVSEIKNKKNIIEKINKAFSYSSNKKIIVEEKVNGIEFGAQTFSERGKCKYVILHEDIMSKNNSKIPVGHIVPFSLIKNDKTLKKIKSEIKRAINCMGVKDGPCNVDCIFTDDKKLFIIEISPRIGATCLPEILEKYTGKDWDLSTIKYLFLKKKFLLKEKKINVISKIFESYKSGYLKKIKYNISPPKNSIVKENVKINEKISKFSDGSKSFGNIVAWSRNRKKLKKIIINFINSIQLELR